jgi:hypothetical protein
MIKLVLSCLWICVITAAAAYFGSAWKAGHSDTAESGHSNDHKQFKSTRPISVPMIANGNLEGYVVVQLGYTIDAKHEHDSLPPDAFLLDETFRALYSDQSLDFKHLEKYDVTALTKSLVDKTNERLGSKTVKDILVQEFNFVAKADISK